MVIHRIVYSAPIKTNNVDIKGKILTKTFRLGSPKDSHIIDVEKLLWNTKYGNLKSKGKQIKIAKTKYIDSIPYTQHGFY